MPCYEPLKGYRSVEKSPAGTPLITFNPLKAINSTQPMTFPCGGCIGCRLDRVDQLATRCMHEASMHAANSFLTLTYSKEHLPADYSVRKPILQNFMKRLRKDLTCKIRFFGCGEYGDENLRPHYHLLIFGYSFPDREFYSTTKGGHPQYISNQLSKSWTFGRATIGNVTYSSAAYCAGYVMKKIGGDKAASHYLRTHPDTGAVVRVEPEFQLCSTNPGLGSSWFEAYKSDIYPSNFVVVDGRQKPIPRYYKLKLQEEELKELEKRKHRETFRKGPEAFREKKANRSKERLAVSAEIKAINQTRRQRNLKDDDQ